MTFVKILPLKTDCGIDLKGKKKTIVFFPWMRYDKCNMTERGAGE